MFVIVLGLKLSVQRGPDLCAYVTSRKRIKTPKQQYIFSLLGNEHNLLVHVDCPTLLRPNVLILLELTAVSVVRHAFARHHPRRYALSWILLHLCICTYCSNLKTTKAHLPVASAKNVLVKIQF